MVQGTSSHSGKSLLVTALCKIFADSGYIVAPFKAQNMSLNSYVTKDGREIARAQALQALAAGVEPTSDMNPILLKPKGNMTSQIVLNGKPLRDIGASGYYSEFAKKEGIRCVKESLQRLMANFDIVVIEGAGSPAEINLYDQDIANMRVADLVDAPVLLIADIDRGGVFASIVGTLRLLKPNHRARIKGLIINKFRGERRILEPGLQQLQRMTKKKIVGVLPYVEDLNLPSEDSVSLEEFRNRDAAPIDIAIVRLPRISNFTDFEPFVALPNVRVRYVMSPSELDTSDLIILPGTKNTVQDLLWLRSKGLASKICKIAKGGTPVIGICGGYQMLGNYVIDESGIEGDKAGRFDGLCLLKVITRFDKYDKVTRRVLAEPTGTSSMLSSKGGRFQAYEIHMGSTLLQNGTKPAFRIVQRGEEAIESLDGAVSDDGLVVGTYLHGIFENAGVREALIGFLMNANPTKIQHQRNSVDIWEESLDRLVRSVRENLDMQEIGNIIGLELRSN